MVWAPTLGRDGLLVMKLPRVQLRFAAGYKSASGSDSFGTSRVRADPLADGILKSCTGFCTAGRTRALLALGLAERVWLAVGCAVLLVRLPFSLAMPLFTARAVDELYGSDVSHDLGRVKHTLLLMAGAGTADALLDFWCV